MTAAEWLAGLARRGISTRLQNGRVRHYPASAYKQLTADDVTFLRQHRAEIKAAMLDAGPEITHAPATVEPTSTPSDDLAWGGPVAASENSTNSGAAPALCTYCGQTPCIGPDHHAFSILHWDDPSEITRREEDALDQFIARERGWPTERMLSRALRGTETEEEQRQRTLRQQLGWESALGTRRT